ncbi:MAG: hypothetical protein JSV45_04700 [Chromatiales bacterium]|nr:MAG: hypothetical protein JSV45_04700 [Chromatiales bacterium]
MHRKLQLALWEAGCVVFVAVAGSILHFAFELSEFWTPLALVAAVNESAWEHSKIYFWPGVVYALVQYTYTREVANNYWFGKALASTVTPLSIFIIYYSYMALIGLLDTKASLQVMLSIMLIGIVIGQLVSYLVLSEEPVRVELRRLALPLYAILIVMYSSLTFFPPRIFLFENFFCYQYTGDYGILPDYTPYRVFTRQGDPTPAGGVNYCAKVDAGGEGD